MTELRLRLKSLAWLAMIAICGVALGPTVSRALLAGDPSPTGAHGAHRHGHAQANAEEAHSPAHVHRHGMSGLGGAVSLQAMPAAGHSGGAAHAGCDLDCCPLCAVAALPFTSTAWLQPAGVAPARSAQHAAADASAMPGRRVLRSSASPRGPPLSS